MTPPNYLGFFLRIVRLGPVHTAGRPLIKCGCRENFSFSQVFSHQKSEITSKKFHKKILPSAFSVCCWLWEEQSPAKTVASPDVSHVRFSAIIDSRSALPLCRH